MPDDAACLPLLAVCEALGLLQLRDLWREIALLAGDRAFSTAEICAHAALSENARLRRAIESACGEGFGPGKVGKLLARFSDVSIAGTVITPIGREGNAVVWSCNPKPERTAQANDATIVALPPARTRHVV